MPEHAIKFAELRDFLADLGFRQIAMSKEHTGFQRDDSNTLIAIPVYKDRDAVAPRHLSAVRVMLDNAGVLSGEEFDHRLGRSAAKPSAS
jgi:hypothetical protein